MKFVRKHESPCGSEAWGSRRARRYKEVVYYGENTEGLAFEHEISKPGEPIISAVVHGKWVLSVVETFLNRIIFG